MNANKGTAQSSLCCGPLPPPASSTSGTPTNPASVSVVALCSMQDDAGTCHCRTIPTHIEDNAELDSHDKQGPKEDGSHQCGYSNLPDRHCIVFRTA